MRTILLRYADFLISTISIKTFTTSVRIAIVVNRSMSSSSFPKLIFLLTTLVNNKSSKKIAPPEWRRYLYGFVNL